MRLIDDNEPGILEDPKFFSEKELYSKIKYPKDAPDIETNISITFKSGIPVKVNNLDNNFEVKGAFELFNYLNKLGCINGIGLLDIVENRSFVHRLMEFCTQLSAGFAQIQLQHGAMATSIIDAWASPPLVSLKLFDEFVNLREKLVVSGFRINPEIVEKILAIRRKTGKDTEFSNVFC